MEGVRRGGGGGVRLGLPWAFFFLFGSLRFVLWGCLGGLWALPSGASWLLGQVVAVRAQAGGLAA